MNYNAKLTEQDKIEIKKLREQGISTKNIALAMNVSKSTINNIIVHGTNNTKRIEKEKALKKLNQSTVQQSLSIINKQTEVDVSDKSIVIKTANPITIQAKPIVEVKQLSLAEKVKSSMVKVITSEALFEKRLEDLCSRSISETSNVFNVVSNNKFFANSGKLVIRKTAMMSTVSKNEEWLTDVFSRGWKTISDRIVEHLEKEGFQTSKDTNDNSVIVSWG